MAWQRLPGSAQRYVDNETGEVVSRRQYQKLIGKPLPSVPKKPGAMHRYTSAIEAAQRDLASQGVRLTKSEVRQLPEIKQAWRDIANTPPLGQRTEEDAKRLARALQAIGRNPREWYFYMMGIENV